jgi:hypothetical protein
MDFFIEAIKIELSEDAYGLRLKTLDFEYPLPGQSLEETMDVLTKNFETVQAKYGKALSKNIVQEDINEISLRIVLYYFYLYNSWRSLYEKERNRSLIFLEKDFEHPYTYDSVIQFFKLRYPNDYAVKCAALLELKVEALLKFETERRDFYDAFR